MNVGFRYPFGRPVTRRPPSAHEQRALFVLGAYPSALHVEWRPPAGGKLGRALPIDDEPEPFWNGEDASDRLAAWISSTRLDPDRDGTFRIPSGLNGPSGAWVDRNVLTPLGQSRATTWITDCLDTYRMSTGVEARIADTYDNGTRPGARLLPHPSESAVVAEALNEHHSRLLDELDLCRPTVVVTLGNAAARVFSELVGVPQRKLTVAGYGQRVEVAVNGSAAIWLPLAHPAAPPRYQMTHELWAATRQRPAQ